jgi:protein involved in polysaccharide export with SLBB domain
LELKVQVADAIQAAGGLIQEKAKVIEVERNNNTTLEAKVKKLADMVCVLEVLLRFADLMSLRLKTR